MLSYRNIDSMLSQVLPFPPCTALDKAEPERPIQISWRG